MVRLDMSEFMERHTVSKLIGSPPGVSLSPQHAFEGQVLIQCHTKLVACSASFITSVMSCLPVARGQSLDLQAFPRL